MKIKSKIFTVCLLTACTVSSGEDVSAKNQNAKLDEIVVSRNGGRVNTAPSTIKSTQTTQSFCEGSQASIEVETLWSNHKDTEASISIYSGTKKLTGRVPSSLNKNITEANSLKIISKCVNNEVEFIIYLNTVLDNQLIGDEIGSFIINSQTSSFIFID